MQGHYGSVKCTFAAAAAAAAVHWCPLVIAPRHACIAASLRLLPYRCGCAPVLLCSVLSQPCLLLLAASLYHT